MAKITELDSENDNTKTKEDSTKGKKTPAKRPSTKSEEIAGVSIVQRLIAVVVVITAYLYGREYLLANYGGEDVEVFAAASEHVPKRSVYVKCSDDYGKKFKKCLPKKCGRFVMDSVVSKHEAMGLRKIVQKGMSYGGGRGGATILDLHSGALSYGDKFINIYSLAGKNKENIFTEADFELYKAVKNKIHKTVASEFEVTPENLYLTKPTFFSRMTNKAAVTVHDEYWHPHIDKVTYGSFYYTSLLYLSDSGKEFKGGKFVFIGKETNSTVEPKTGRLSFFTSGSENEHFVEHVTEGTRFAITVSFTCDEKFAIEDPNGKLEQR